VNSEKACMSVCRKHIKVEKSIEMIIIPFDLPHIHSSYPHTLTCVSLPLQARQTSKQNHDATVVRLIDRYKRKTSVSR